MAGSIGRRIEALEGSVVREPCEGCGFDGDPSKMDYVVEWDALGPLEKAARDEPEPQPEWCGTCGRQTAYVVTWGDPPDGSSNPQEPTGRTLADA